MGMIPSGNSAFLERSDLYELDLKRKPQTDKNLSVLNISLVL